MGKKNPILVQRNQNFVPRLRTLANPPQIDENCESTAPNNRVTLHEVGHLDIDMENPNMSNDLSGFISSNEGIVRKYINKIL